jgi:hypothetical protein
MEKMKKKPGWLESLVPKGPGLPDRWPKPKRLSWWRRLLAIFSQREGGDAQ